MVNVQELESMIQENLRQNEEYRRLAVDLSKQVCKRHGAQHFRVCLECHGFRCTHCSPQTCQCWNDE